MATQTINNSVNSTFPINDKALQVMRKELKASIGDISNSIIGLQDKIHKALITGVLVTWIDKNPQGLTDLLNALVEVKGFARVESVAYWLTNIAGLHSIYNKDTNAYSIKFCVSTKAKSEKSLVKSDLGVNFTYDKKHLDLCKLKTNRFWLVAPVKVIELKVQDDLDKLFKGLITNAAKSVEAGALTIEDIEKYTTSLVERVKAAQGSKNVTRFIEKLNNVEVVTATIEA